MFQHNPVLAHWAFESITTTLTTVLPDGCRAVIGRQEPGGRTTWCLTDWVDTAYTVHGNPGQTWVGYRLQPSAVASGSQLLKRHRTGRLLLSGPAPLSHQRTNQTIGVQISVNAISKQGLPAIGCEGVSLGWCSSLN